MSNGDDEYRRMIEAQLDDIYARVREAFRGKYRDQIKALLGISRADIEAITPDPTNMEKYDMLMEVVKEASRKNMEVAQLKERIENLGEVAVKIAKHVPSVAALLA
jgi:hypothetical protein